MRLVRQPRDFDVVVTDLNMREMSGIELCERVAANRPDVPVVVLTAFGSLDTAVAATVATRLAFLWLPVGVGLIALPVAIRSVRRREQPLAARIGAPYPEEAA